MAEVILNKQHPVSVDEGDQQRKGDEYERRAADEVSGWAIFCGNFEKAIQSLERACSLYKPLKASPRPVCRGTFLNITSELIVNGISEINLRFSHSSSQATAHVVINSGSIYFWSDSKKCDSTSTSVNSFMVCFRWLDLIVDKLAGVHMKIARCYLKMGKVEEGASTYVAAAKYYKKVPSQGGAITCLSRAAMLFEEIGQLSTSARYYQEVGDIFEAEGKISESIGQYRKAAEIFSANDSQVLSNQCRTKVAKHAAELERYTEAIPIFEALAKDAVITGASKKTMKEMLLYAGLCYLCSYGGDGVVVKQALQGLQEIEPNFASSRESKILLYLATAFEKRNRNLYTEVLNTHEVLFRNDPLARLLSNRGQKKLKAMPALAGVKTTSEFEDSEVRQANLDELQLEEPTETN